MAKRNILILVLVLLLIGLVAGGWVFLTWQKKSQAARQALEKGGQAAEKIIDSAVKGALPSVGVNPLESKPDVNPVDKANPFKNIKINPFE